MANYIALVHKDKNSCFGVSFPDMPGCFAAGDTPEEAFADAVTALSFHVEGILEEGMEISFPRSLEDLSADKEFMEDADGAFIMMVPLFTEVGRVKRVNITMDENTLAAADAAAKQRGLTRSSFLAQSVRHEIMGRRGVYVSSGPRKKKGKAA